MDSCNHSKAGVGFLQRGGASETGASTGALVRWPDSKGPGWGGVEELLKSGIFFSVGDSTDFESKLPQFQNKSEKTLVCS